MNSSDNTFSVEKPEDSTGFLLWQVTSLWQRKIKKALEPYDITHSQYVLLASIYWFTLKKREVTQVVLSAHTQIDPMTTSTVLRALQKKKLVIRKEHQTDTRAKTVQLTPAGKSCIKKAVIAVEQFDKNFFSMLSAQLNGFNKNLLKLLINK